MTRQEDHQRIIGIIYDRQAATIPLTDGMIEEHLLELTEVTSKYPTNAKNYRLGEIAREIFRLRQLKAVTCEDEDTGEKLIEALRAHLDSLLAEDDETETVRFFRLLSAIDDSVSECLTLAGYVEDENSGCWEKTVSA